jgi:hypothetical protein
VRRSNNAMDRACDKTTSNKRWRMRKTNDAQRCSSAYLKAHQRAFAWAEKAMIYRSAAKIAETKAAVRNVRRSVRAIAMLEAKRAEIALDS